MTVQEFSDEFDVLLDSYSSDSQFGDSRGIADLRPNEYEKSIYLTAAQEEILLELYTGKNNTGGSYEKTEEVRRYLAGLVCTYSVKNQITQLENLIPLSTLSKFYSVPNDLWFITYEQVKFSDTNLGCLDTSTGGVVPITHDEYYRVMRNPFKGPSKTRVIRLDIQKDVVELISKYNIEEYLLRYIAKPQPIILEDLPDNLAIDSNTKSSTSTLHTALHRPILERAVYNFLKYKSINNKPSK